MKRSRSFSLNIQQGIINDQGRKSLRSTLLSFHPLLDVRSFPFHLLPFAKQADPVLKRNLNQGDSPLGHWKFRVGYWIFSHIVQTDVPILY